MKKMMRTQALCAILLLLLTPVAFAEIQRSSLVVYGDDNVPGFVRTTDTLNANASVRLTGDLDITPDQVRINLVPFTTCAPISGEIFQCLFESSQPSVLSSGPKTYSVILRDDAGAVKDSAPISFVVDASVPTIVSSTINQTLMGASSVSVTTQVSDPGSCSGIKNVEWSVDGVAFNSVTETNMQLCSKGYTTLIETTTIGAEGPHTICAKATDQLNQQSTTSCTQLTADFTAPTALADTLKITDAFGAPIDFINGQFQAKIVIDLFDIGAGVEPASVFADLSALNPSFTRRSGACLSVGVNTLRCTWSVSVLTQQTITGTITFSLRDLAGNAGATQVPFVMQVDNTRPIAQALSSNHGDVLAREDNTLTLTLFEESSGFDENQVFLNLAAISGDTHKAPDNCIQQGTNWLCTYSDIDVTASGLHGRTVTLTLSADSKDDANNAVDVPTQFSFTVDNRRPVIQTLNVTSDSPEGLFLSGGFLVVRALIEEEGDVVATGNFSSVITDFGVSPGVCSVLEDGLSECVWQEGIGPLKSGKITRQIRFGFSDARGNTVSDSREITIFGVDEDLNPDYIDVTLGASSPFAIDKQLMELSNAHMAFPITLTGDSAVPIRVDFVDCLGEGAEFFNNAPPYNNKPLLITSTDLSQVVLEFSFDRQVFPGESLSFDCSLNILSLVDDQRLSNFETETFNVTIPFYNAPYGTLDSTVQKKIDDTMEGVLISSLEWLDMLETVIKYAEKLCGIYGTLEKIMFIVGKVTSFWGTCCGSFYESAACCPAQQISATQLEGTKEALVGSYNMVKKWCALIGCTAYDAQWKDNNDVVVDDYWDFAQKNNLPITQYRTNNGWLGNVEPKNSIILSAAFFCIPGVVHNLQKWRQTECQYVECLQNTKNGLPVSVCEKQRGYMQCKYVLGEIFNLIPFAAAFSDIAKNVDMALKNPLNTIGFALSAACSFQCRSAAVGGLCDVCSIAEFISIGKDVFCDLGFGFEDRCKQGLFGEQGMLNGGDFWNVGDGACASVIETYKSEGGNVTQEEGKGGLLDAIY